MTTATDTVDNTEIVLQPIQEPNYTDQWLDHVEDISRDAQHRKELSHPNYYASALEPFHCFEKRGYHNNRQKPHTTFRTNPCSPRSRSPMPKLYSPCRTTIPNTGSATPSVRSRRKAARCPLRIAELALPSKRQCIETWRNKAHTLPGFMLERLKQHIIDQNTVANIPDAIRYFKAGKSTPRNRKANYSKTPKNGYKHTQEYLMAIRNSCAIFGHSIAQVLIKPQNIVLTPKLERLSHVVYQEISDIMKYNKMLYRQEVDNKTMHKEVANKITIWIEQIMQDTTDKLLEEDLRVKKLHQRISDQNEQFVTLIGDQTLVTNYEDEELEEEEGPVLDFLDNLVDHVFSICASSSESEDDDFTDIALQMNEGYDLNHETHSSLYYTIDSADLQDADNDLLHEIDLKEVLRTELESIVDNVVFRDDIDQSEYNVDEVDEIDDNEQYIRENNDNEHQYRVNTHNAQQNDNNYEQQYKNNDSEHQDLENHYNVQQNYENNLNEHQDGETNEYEEQKGENNNSELYDNPAEGHISENINEPMVVANSTELTINGTPIEDLIEKTSNNDGDEVKYMFIDNIVTLNDTDDVKNMINNIIDQAYANTTEEDKVVVKERLDEKNKTVSFSRINMVIRRNIMQDSDYYSNQNSENNSSFNKDQEELWKTTSEIYRPIVFGPLNENLLSNADESWPNDMPLHMLKLSESVSKSIISLGKITETEEGLSISPDIESEEHIQTLHLVEQNRVIESEQINNKLVQAVVDYDTKSTEISIQLNDNTKNSSTIQTVVVKSSVVDTRLGNKGVNTKSPYFKDSGKGDHAHENEKNMILEATKPRINIQQPKFEYKVNPKSAPHWALMHPSDEIQKRDKRRTKQLGIRKWCRDLELAFGNLERWNFWLGNSCKKIILCKQKQDMDELFAKQNKKEQIQHWVKLQKSIEKDIIYWTKLNQRAQENLKNSCADKLDKTDKKIVTTEYCMKCNCKNYSRLVESKIGSAT